jgi:apolipoprotein N-acyltransferase
MTTAALSHLPLPRAATRAVPAARVPTWGWLLLGIAFTALSGMRFNVALLGWVAATPWLLYLRRTDGWRSRLLLFGALQVALFFSMLKIVTAPLPWFFALMFSVPTAAGAFVLYALFEGLRRRLGDGWGLLLFPALTVGAEWLTAHSSEMGSWGALAYTQLDNLALLQVASLFGLGGVSALLAATTALAAVLLDSPTPRRWGRAALAIGALVLAGHAYGSFRLYQPTEGPLVTVATVTTDVHMVAGGLPPQDEVDAGTDALFERSAAAADRGAQLIVWNEGATAVSPEDEPALLARGQALARARGVDLVMAYVVPLEGMARFENKYTWLTPEGPVETYLKHHPVPGEGAVPGTDPLVAHQRP